MSIKNFGLFVLAAAMASSMFAQASTTVTRTSDYTFPLVGLASSETIEVNLINLASNSNNGTAASCAGSVTFSTASQGTVIGGATNFTLAANAVASIEPSVSSNVSASGTSRVLLKVVVASTTTIGVPCSLAYTLNTFDTASGATHVFLVGQAAATVLPVTNFGR